MRRAAAGLVGLALCLGACTPMRWEHPDTGTTRTAEDLAECDQLALEQSWRYSGSDPLMNVPHFHLLPNGRYAYDPLPRTADTYANTGELRNVCMRSKGYQLVPIPPTTAP